MEIFKKVQCHFIGNPSSRLFASSSSSINYSHLNVILFTSWCLSSPLLRPGPGWFDQSWELGNLWNLRLSTSQQKSGWDRNIGFLQYNASISYINIVTYAGRLGSRRAVKFTVSFYRLHLHQHIMYDSTNHRSKRMVSFCFLRLRD